MEYRTLDLNILSAHGLNNSALLSKMSVYALVSITGDPHENRTVKTPVHRHAGTDPVWNFATKFVVNESLASRNQLALHIELRHQRSVFGHKQVGRVHVPLIELLDQPGDGKSLQRVDYQVIKPSGKPHGSVSFSYKFGENFTAAPAPKEACPPPPMGHSAAPYGYPPPPAYAGYPPPPQQQGGYAYAYPSQTGYGYPGQAGYGPPGQAGYGYPAVQAAAKKKRFGMGMGAGLLGGALGGLLIGDMMSDASAYDAGYDAGFDDGGGFDF